MDESPAWISDDRVIMHFLAIGHFYSRALHEVASLGIADALAAGPVGAAELARQTGVHEGALIKVMRMMVVVGVFDQTPDGSFALTSRSELLLSDSSNEAGSLARIYAGPAMHDRWARLGDCLRTGGAAYKAMGRANPLVALDQHSTAAAAFDVKQSAAVRRVAAVLLQCFDFASCKTVVDVGGGTGGLLIEVLRQHSSLRGVLLDRPGVARQGEWRIREAGLEARCSAIAGDFFSTVPAGRDVYLLKHVLHDWDDPSAIRLLSACREAMYRGSRLLIIEELFPEHVECSMDSAFATTNDVNLLVCFGGAERSAEEFSTLAESSGLSVERMDPLQGRLWLIECRRNDDLYPG